jgi:hypothetical protein
MKTTKISAFLMLVVALAGSAWAADEPLKPYFLSSSEPGAISDKVDGVRQALKENGLEIVGEYEPYEGAQILAVTCDALKQTAAKSDFGGYGAALRVSLTEADGKVQVAWTNPTYFANIYRMADDLGAVTAKLEAALGKGSPFGSKKGMTAKALRKYHYMIAMPYFDDAMVLAKHASNADAVAAVERGLADDKNGTSKVYRVDVPGKEEVVFGVALESGVGADKAVMETCDLGELKHTLYMPYEMLVSDGTVYALHAKFRIALSFPDLGMVTFMKISSAPGAIEAALRSASSDTK